MSERDMDTAEQSQFGMAPLKREGDIYVVDDPWEECNDETDRKPPSPMVMPGVVGPHMFVFRPISHGPKSLFVVADSPGEALHIAMAHVASAGPYCAYDYFGFGTDEYVVEAVSHGQVAENDNE